MSDNESSDAESIDSDTELQRAFASGHLKPGLNVEVAPKLYINNVAAMKHKLEEFKQHLEWIERLDLTNDPTQTPGGNQATEEQGDSVADDDFKREMKFYRQAQDTALEGIAKLHKLNIKTRRPEDYFAEMAKSDDHMKKVREKLLERQLAMERSEKAKKLRDLRKYGRKVQQDVLQKRQKEKKEMLDAVKKFRKGQKDKLEFLNSLKSNGMKQKPRQKKGDRKHVPNKRRDFKNKKFGFGGQKKRGKYNSSGSSADMRKTFSIAVNQKQQGKKKGKNYKHKPSRPGKAKRQKMKNRKR
ncbi:hypothetical protein CHS0354_019434 [Potamilus streckersoni]|uniref:rRNA-processing protein EBP2 n=1 Tax=Potamilus streckersoni TaxID=2493646 RepID=A0AAE0SI49_9BIVA|nr:hypothetical protein CHS0354_019434 [Potamilus streckersoni]